MRMMYHHGLHQLIDPLARIDQMVADENDASQITDTDFRDGGEPQVRAALPATTNLAFGDDDLRTQDTIASGPLSNLGEQGPGHRTMPRGRYV
ncbi:MAG: hypothetical protein GTO53_00530 [Planctomycetales bacterium]|nr:hypothetical protein [Planctomycetales bacterium]NIN07171.1 hypothetical protein [Planctomycetales bacterium]NIP03349.1 hypothetical protein [Planctomycetales bacterium]